MQIGEAAVIAERTGIDTIADFRPSDMAAGGKGAPLVPFLDYQLFRHPELARIALNIGGIANITVIPANAKPADVIAFDTGPGNMIMDAVAPPFDRDGALAREGQVNTALLDRLLADPYYRREPPKACGREQYGADFVRETRIDITTATELTARTIALAIARYPDTREVIVSGGGAHNAYLMERLRALVVGASDHLSRIRNRRGHQGSHLVRGARVPDAARPPGQHSLGNRRAQTHDPGQDFAWNKVESRCVIRNRG